MKYDSYFYISCNRILKQIFYMQSNKKDSLNIDIEDWHFSEKIKYFVFIIINLYILSLEKLIELKKYKFLLTKLIH